MNKHDGTLHSLGFRKLYHVTRISDVLDTPILFNSGASYKRMIGRIAVAFLIAGLIMIALMFAGCEPRPEYNSGPVRGRTFPCRIEANGECIP